MAGPILDTGSLAGDNALAHIHPRKIVNIVLLHAGVAYFVKSIEVTSNSGDQYYQAVTDVKTWVEGEYGMFVVAIVGDNASAVQNALARCGFQCSLGCHFRLVT